MPEPTRHGGCYDCQTTAPALLVSVPTGGQSVAVCETCYTTRTRRT